MRIAAVFAACLICTIPGAVVAQNVVVAVGGSLAPYAIVDEWRGMEFDIVREALAVEGHTITPRFQAFARVAKELESGQADAAMTMRPDTGVKAYFSDSHIIYRNYAITLEKRHLSINSVDDLAGKSVMAFQSASQYLGPAYRAAVENNPYYREEAHQALQPTMLFLDRVDVVIADRLIFNWFSGDPDVKAKVDTTQPVVLHPIFTPTEYYVAFRDVALRDSFNRGLKKLRENGTYGKIVARYSSSFKEARGD